MKLRFSKHVISNEIFFYHLFTENPFFLITKDNEKALNFKRFSERNLVSNQEVDFTPHWGLDWHSQDHPLHWPVALPMPWQ